MKHFVVKSRNQNFTVKFVTINVVEKLTMRNTYLHENMK